VTTPLVILGCGYIGSRVARAALAAGRHVRVCARSTGRLAPLGALGAEIKYLDAAIPKQLGPALAGMRGGTLVYSIPPIASLPPREAVTKGLQAAAGAGLARWIHFSSSGLYGDAPDDDAWIDDDTEVALNDPPMSGVLTDEEAALASTFERPLVTVLRLAPVYGPGRGVRARLRKGDYRLLDEGQHTISRVHVDDVAGVVFAAEQHAAHKSRYLVADDQSTTQLEYATWLCERLGLPLPPCRPAFAPGKAKVAHRNRRIRNTRLKADLGLTLRYPTFREGEAAIEAEEAAAGT
jgi:nucleoside-diphosphate-sugar epimerase